MRWIHRAWDIEARIRILMFDDRIEIVSPGGLPSGITEEEYLAGKLSVLRNRNLANVFYRLGFVGDIWNWSYENQTTI